MDERREQDRRDEDVRLAEAVQRLETRHERFYEEFVAHTHPELDQIVTLLVGTEGDLLAGEEPHPGLIKNVEGLAADMKYIKAQTENGGLKVNLPMWSKIAALALTVVNIFIGLQVLL